MPEFDDVVAAIVAASSWNARVGLIRRVPDEFGRAQHQAVYAAIAERIYVPQLAPDFAYVHWRPEYELPAIQAAYDAAHAATAGFTRVTDDDLEVAIARHPQALPPPAARADDAGVRRSNGRGRIRWRAARGQHQRGEVAGSRESPTA